MDWFQLQLYCIIYTIVGIVVFSDVVIMQSLMILFVHSTSTRVFSDGQLNSDSDPVCFIFYIME